MIIYIVLIYFNNSKNIIKIRLSETLKYVDELNYANY